jgi:hypothetical protein
LQITTFYLGYQRTTSSDIQNAIETSVGDFNNLFVTASLDYRKLDQIIHFQLNSIKLYNGTGNRGYQMKSQKELKAIKYSLP